jgi:hypothetical protein
MTGLVSLWLPILISAVLVFVASSVIHMMSPWHKSDYPMLPNEDAFRGAVGPLNLPAGDYMIPRPSTRGDLKSPEFLNKVEQGPNVVMTVMPNGPFSMSRSLGLWFVYIVVVEIFAAYVAGRALPTGLQIHWSCRLCRLHPRVVADVDLVPTRMGHDNQGDNRWADLRAAQCRRDGLALAALILRDQRTRATEPA